MRNKIFLLGAINLLQFVSYTVKPLDNNFNQTEITTHCNLSEEQVIDILKKQFHTLTLVEEIQRQVLKDQRKINKIQTQIKSDQEQNTYVSKPNQNLEKEFENQFDIFEFKLNKYLSNISKIKNLKQKIENSQKEIITMLKTIKSFKNYFNGHLHLENIYDIICVYSAKLEQIINNNDQIDLYIKRYN